MAPFLLGAMSNERTDVGVCGAAGGGGGTREVEDARGKRRCSCFFL